ncbi:hypothetical protein GCM10010174_26040 [Kutzneria viridogrisea]|uniref:RuvC-like resolvase n=1 Tax=Kutzneria viridogrisea TaxID=47990 RepID=A0ABR6BRW2_9PSEU|nr:hypothetical protein [Kutzneria viridogrisea]
MRLRAPHHPTSPAGGSRETRTDAPPAPDARVLALDIGLFGHYGSISSMFWYQNGGHLHAHVAELLPEDATLLDQLDILEALAESYEEYWRIAPVVVLGVTVLSPIGRQQVRDHLGSWHNPPWRRRLVTVGEYASEHTGTRALTSRKKLRDLIAQRLTDHTLTVTRAQHDAIAQYTGRRAQPGRGTEEEWRTDEVDALALPVALSCLAAHSLLPPPLPTAVQLARQQDRAHRAAQHQFGTIPFDGARSGRVRG